MNKVRKRKEHAMLLRMLIVEGVEEQYRWKEYFEELLNLRNEGEGVRLARDGDA